MMASLLLLSTGSNSSNQLSHSFDEDTHVFHPCTSSTGTLFPPPDTTRILNVAFGANHTVCLLEDDRGARSVWGCGGNGAGQLGADTKAEGFRELAWPSVPDELGLKNNVDDVIATLYAPKLVAASWTTTFVAFSPQSTSSPLPDILLALGSNDFSELGNGSRGGSDGSAWHVFPDETIERLVAGPRHAILTTTTKASRQRVLGWGAARHSQLSSSGEAPATVTTPTALSLPSDDAIVDIALGFRHSLLLTSTARVLALGRPTNPAVISSFDGVVSQMAATWSSSYVFSASAAVVHSFGKLSSTWPISLPSPARLIAGSEHILFHSLSSGEILGWGWNEHGNLGDGTLLDRTEPGRVWPPVGGGGLEEEEVAGRKAVACWAGYGTSWILTERG